MFKSHCPKPWGGENGLPQASWPNRRLWAAARLWLVADPRYPTVAAGRQQV